MKNRVRVTSDQNVVTNAKIELLGPDDEYVDVSNCVTGVNVELKVGDPSLAHIDLITCDVRTEAIFCGDGTLDAFAETLRFHGWKVEKPELLEVTSVADNARKYVGGDAL